MRSGPHEKLGQKAATVTLAVLASVILLTLSVPGQGYAQEDTASVEISGQTYDIMYEITGGTVQGMTANPDTMTLLVSVDSNSSGTLKIWLPTNVMDAPDSEFTVVEDGQSGNFVVDELDPTADARVLQIEFETGTQEIEIVGTTMVPEFGSIGAVILSVAVVGVIIATITNQKYSGLQSR